MKARHMCCNGDGVFVEMSDGSMWWRRHEWLSDRWQFVGRPGATDRLRSSVTTKARGKRRRR